MALVWEWARGLEKEPGMGWGAESARRLGRERDWAQRWWELGMGKGIEVGCLEARQALC